MRISTKLWLSVYIPVLLALILIVALVISYLQMRTIQENGDIIRRIRSSITGLNHAVFSYILYHEERPKEQFLSEYDTILGLFDSAQISSSAQQKLLDSILENCVEMKNSFLQMVALNESGNTGSASEHQAAEDRLSGLLLLQSYEADSIASVLRNLVDQGIRTTEEKTAGLIFLVLVLATIPLTFVMAQTRKSIVSSLSNLVKGTGIIGSGNLEYRIETKSKDELGDLSRAFNRMTVDLKTVTASKADLEKEIGRREEIEEALRISNKELEENAARLKEEILEREKAEAKVRISRDFLEIANRHTGTKELLRRFIQETKNITGCEALGIRVLDEFGDIPYIAYDGFTQKFYESESPLSIKTDKCMCINVVKGTTDPAKSFYTPHGSFYMNGTTKFLATVSETDKGWTRNVCNATGYESVALIPIKLGSQILGLVHLADRRENMVPLDTVRILEEATASLALSIQRTMAEEALKESEEKFRIVSDFTYGWEYWRGPSNNFIYVSPACQRFTGYTSTEFVNNPDLYLNIVHPDDRERMKDHVLEASHQLDQDEFEFRIYRRDGELRWMSHICQPVVDAKGNYLGRRASNRDITERKKSEAALEQYSRELENANKELEAFNYSVSHDLRQPLRALDGFSLAIVENIGDQLDNTNREYLNRVRKASQTMGLLIDDLLKLSRINRAEMVLDNVNLSEVVRSISEELKQREPARQAEFIISPDIFIRGDRPLLTIALRNILENAWKFTRKCEQTRIEVGTTKQNGDIVYFFRDNGAGFDMKYYDKLFQPFQRLHDRKDYEGTGIGLATVQRVIRRHSGRVWAESEIDKGTTVYFTLSSQ
jgi:PAS domain S-box-containing protein